MFLKFWNLNIYQEVKRTENEEEVLYIEQVYWNCTLLKIYNFVQNIAKYIRVF